MQVRGPARSITLHLKACNLWTQESHANRIQALIARPETDYGRRLAPIGFEFGFPEKHCRGAPCVFTRQGSRYLLTLL